MTDNPVFAEARHRIRAEAAGVLAVEQALNESFLHVARVLLGTRGKVFVTGSGTSGTMARRMAHLFSVSGTPSSFLPAMDALHGTLGVVTHGDVLILISKGGGSDELNDLATRARARGAYTIALTSRERSEMVDRCDYTVVVPLAEDVDPGNVIAMGSTLQHAVWGDAMAVVLMRARDYQWDEVLFTHPGGAVGKASHIPDRLAQLNLAPIDPTTLVAPDDNS